MKHYTASVHVVCKVHANLKGRLRPGRHLGSARRCIHARGRDG
jgi:hypothetical protein